MSENLTNQEVEVKAEAETETLTPTQIDTRHAHNLLERALNQVERGELEKGLVLCRQALHLAPHSFPVFSMLAMVLRRVGKLDEAVINSEKALALLPDNELERGRLSELRAAQTNGTGAPALHINEWEQFRLEMQREIKLSNLLAATQMPSPSSSPLLGDHEKPPMEFAPALPETPHYQALPSPAKSPLQTLKVYRVALGAALIAGIVTFMVVRSVRQPPPNAVPATTQTTGITEDGAIANSPAGTIAPGSDPSAPVSSAPQPIAGTTPPTASAPLPSGPVPAPGRPSTPLPRSAVPTRPTAPSGSTTQAPVVSRPPAGRAAEPAPRSSQEDPRPVTAAPSRPQFTPVPTPATPTSDDDVGPRFSAPKDDDDVGPRFSNP